MTHTLEVLAKFAGTAAVFLFLFFWFLRHYPKALASNARISGRAAERLSYAVFGTALLALSICAIAFVWSKYVEAETKRSEKQLEEETKRSERTIALFLTHNGKVIRKGFSGTYMLQGRSATPLEGIDGHASLAGIPLSASSISTVHVACEGFTQISDGPFPIVEGRTEIPMSDSDTVPWMLDDYPNPEGRIPTRDIALGTPPRDPKTVSFGRQNLTGKPLYVLLYDCSAHWSVIGEGARQLAKWTRMELPAAQRVLWHSRFRKGSGWFVIYVSDGPGRHEYVATRNLFESTNPHLIVRKATDDKRNYVCTFDP